MNIKYAAISRKGKRFVNEDSFRISDSTDEGRWMGIVCDGLGGHAMGEVASDLVANVITDYWEKHPDREKEAMVKEACTLSSGELDKKSNELHHCEMGTTMVMVSIVDDIATIAHVGDSRCYLIRPEYDEDGSGNPYKILYKTQNHVHLDFGWEVLSRCFISYEGEKAVPEIFHQEVKAGDRLLLCSDGVYKSISQNMLIDCLLCDKTPTEIIDMIQALCEENGDDNYTAIFAVIQ